MDNIYATYGLTPVINADGRMTALGVSTISDEVARVMKEAAQNYVVMDTFIKRLAESWLRLLAFRPFALSHRLPPELRSR